MAAIGRGVVRVLAALFAVLLGVAAGLLGAFVHPGVIVVGGIAWPVGLLLALGLQIGALVLAAGLADRTGVWLAGCGWVGVVLLLTWPRTAGDIVVPGTWYGYAFLVGGMLITVVGAFVISLRALTTAAPAPSDAALSGR